MTSPPPPRTSSASAASSISSPQHLPISARSPQSLAFTSPAPTISSTFPSRTTSRPGPVPAPLKVHYPSYEHVARSDSPAPRSATPTSSSFSHITTASAVGAGAGTPTKGHGWGALRRAVLPPHRNWPVLNPNEPGELYYPAYGAVNKDGGRATPSGGRSTPIAQISRDGGSGSGTGGAVGGSSGLSRLVGGARKRKQMPERNVQHKFAGEIAKIEALFRSPGDASTIMSGTDQMGREPTSTVPGKRRQGSTSGGYGTPRAGEGGADPLQALALLDNLLRNTGSLPDQSVVLAILLKPFRGDVGTQEEAAARVALDIFQRMSAIYQPQDGEEELERWRWLLKAMEWDSVETRVRGILNRSSSGLPLRTNPSGRQNRLAGIIATSVSPTPHSQFWTIAVSSLTIQSLLSALVNTLYFLSPVPSSNSSNTIRKLIDDLASGRILLPDSQQLALTLGFPLPTFESLTRIKLCRMVVFEGLLLISVGGEATLREWLVQSTTTSEDLLERYWVDDAGGLMNGRLVSLWGRVCHLLLSSRAPQPLLSLQGDGIGIGSNDPEDVFSTSLPSTTAPPRSQYTKKHLGTLLSNHYPVNGVSSLSPALRGRLIYATLSFFSHLPSASYTFRESPNPPKGSHSSLAPPLSKHELAAKMWIAEAWRADKAAVTEAVRLVIRELDLDALAGIVGVMMLGMSDQVNESVAVSVMGTLFERLGTAGASASESKSLLALLQLLSSRHPQIFFKPLFTVASSSTDASSRSALSTVVALSSLLGPADYILKDAEMMAVVLMTDVGATKSEETDARPIGFQQARVGQLAILVELIRVLRTIREQGDESPRLDREGAIRFADSFESRFSLFLLSREQSVLLPYSQRILICALLFELRMLSKPPHRPLWLPRLLVWATSSTLGSKATVEPRKKTKAAEDTPALPSIEVTAEVAAEPIVSFAAVRLLYENSATSSPRLSRTNVPAPSLQTSAVAAAKDAAQKLKSRVDILDSLSSSPLPSALKLLVAVNSSLSEADLTTICRVAWMSVDDSKRTSFLPACYLVLLAGEKIFDYLEGLLIRDIRSSSSAIRQAVVVRLMSLFSARFDILTQPSADRSRKRPFKAAKQQIAFVPLEVGSPAYVAQEEPETTRLKVGGSLPPDVFRALKELGWDEQTDEQTLSERQRRPLSLLPWLELAFDNAAEVAPPSPGSPNAGALLRRNSSAGNYLLGSAKRKPVVTPAMASVFLRLADLLRDPDAGVASTSREALMTLLRDDPAMLCRPLLVALSKPRPEQLASVRRLRQIMLIQAALPCGAAHHLFNHIGGLLKGLSREVGANDSQSFAATLLPALATLASQISDFHLRDLRKNKIEHLFLTSGAFWYDSSSPLSPMFPRASPTIDPAPLSHLAIPSTTFHLIMARNAQNTLQAGYLRRFPREASTLKKLAGSFSLPSTFKLPVSLETQSFLPAEVDTRRPAIRTTRQHQDIIRTSALVARAWLLSLIQVLQGMNRHFNVRSELETLFDGVNRILLVHGDDTNLVGIALRACMLASTRFRRLFASNNGFGIFVPVLFKTFVDAKDNHAIRSSIQYAWQRFFRSHEESFVFQAFGALTPIFAAREVGESNLRAMSDDLFHLVEALQGNLLDVADIAGIRGANEREEREALIHQANDRPEVFLATFTQTDADQASRLGTALGDAKPFALDSSLKLFFTVIAFDPMSKRAGEFLRLFRLLVPNFCRANDKTRAVLRDGIEALATVFSKSAGWRQRGSTVAKAGDDAAGPKVGRDASREERSDASTWLAMRRSFLLVVEAFHNTGGELSSTAMQKILEIVRLSLREPTPSASKASATFIRTYTASVIGPGSAPTNAQIIALLNELAPFVRLYIDHVDFSSFFDALAHLRHDIAFQQDVAVVTLIVQKIIGPTLDACSAFSGNDSAAKFPSHLAAVRLVATWSTTPLVDALGELDRQSATSSFLASFVFPLVVELAAQDHTLESTSERAQFRAAWLRILTYTVGASSSTQLTSAPRTSAASIAISLQILKIILLGGEEHLNFARGSWLKLAGFVRDALARSGAAFLGDALDTLRRASSLAASQSNSLPLATPVASSTLPQRFNVSVSDYALWSLIELLSLYPSPILLHLRLFIRDKLAQARFAAPARGLGRNDSVTSSVERRRGSSVFAKPLLSNSTSGAAPAPGAFRSRAGSRSFDKGSDSRSLAVSQSPGASPVLGASRHHRRASSVAPSDVLFRPTLEVFARDYLPISTTTPATPSATPTTFPKIQHLGLVKHQPKSGPFDYLDQIPPTFNDSATISNPRLAFQTVERVRIVQIVFGESPIDVPGRVNTRADGEEPGLKAWTRAEAFRSVIAEASLLEDEFRDVLLNAVGSKVAAVTD